MARDIGTPLVGLASLFPATLLYGVNVVMFIICLAILLRKRVGENKPLFLLGAICVQFFLCTAHVTCAFGAAVNAFRTVGASPTGTTAQLIHVWISPLGKWTASQQLMYTLNNFVGDIILIWRLYVVYGNNWLITIAPICLACAEVSCNIYTIATTFLNPTLVIASLSGKRNDMFDQVVIAGFSLMATTQVVITALLAGKIYYESLSVRRISRSNSRGLSTYSNVMWMLVESGSAMALIDLIWLAVWKQGLSGTAQTILAIIGQLSALVPFSIIARVGLRLAFNGRNPDSGYISKESGVTSTALEFQARSGTTTTGTEPTVTELGWKDRSYPASE